jgi:signal transduction histidine kinase
MDAHQTKIYTAILIASAVIGSILIYFIVLLIRQQQHSNALYRAKILAEITTLENERRRVASDLHDDLGPLLSAIKFKLSSIDIADGEDEKQMEESVAYLDDIIIRLREISHDLMPTSLLHKGIVIAMAEFINKITPLSTLEIQFTHQDIPILDTAVAINLYRIMQEIVHNTLKHAHASVLNIELNMEGESLMLMTTDNGKGFDYTNVSLEHAGLGLRTIMSRTDIMNGKLYVNSQPNKGTSYTIQIPATYEI